jgi:hypothetical protein
LSYGFTITAKGFSLMAKLVAGNSPKLEITRVMVGSGRVADDIDPATLIDMISPVALATSTEPLVDGSTLSFVVEYRSDLNGGLGEGIWIYEFGIYALDPDEGEVLLYYATLGDYPQYVTAYQDGAVDIRRFPVSIVLTDELEVVISYPPLAFMTAEDVSAYCITVVLPLFLVESQKQIDAHNTDPQAHPDIRNQISLLGGRVGRLEDMLINDISSNPFLVTFEDLDGVIVEGVWNAPLARIEF